MKDRARYTLFALRPDGQKEKEGWVNLHLLLWKHVIFSLVQVDTEDEPFEPYRVWNIAWRRFEKKALAKQEGTKLVLRRAASRGDEPPDVTNRGDSMSPLAEINADGDLVWDDELVDKLKKLGVKPPV